MKAENSFFIFFMVFMFSLKSTGIGKSLWFDSEGLVAQLHETEKINFVLHGAFLRPLVVEFRVGQGFES